MIIQKRISEIDVRPGDRVVAISQWRDMLVIVTERGAIFKVRGEQHEY